MSSKRMNDSFLVETQSEETERLLHTCGTSEIKEFVSLEEMKNLNKEENFKWQEKNKEKFENDEFIESAEDFIILVHGKTERNEPGDVAGKQKAVQTNEPPRGKHHHEIETSVRDESKVDDEIAFEKLASLAEGEESEKEGDFEQSNNEQETLLLYENIDNNACEKCFKILEENADNLTQLSCSEKTCTSTDPSFKEKSSLDETTDQKEERSCKMLKNVTDLDSSGSFRASIHSLSTCHDSLSSSRECPSKKDLYLDLECRICHDNEGQDLISPCHCAGTSKWVHESCIIKWIRHTKTKQCEICTCPIAVKRKKKPIDQWTRPTATCGPCNKLDIWYCFVLALCILIIIGFVVLQAHYDVTDQIETTVIFASIYVLCGMIITMKIRYFWSWFVQRSSFWGNWKNLNEEWRIIEAHDANVQSPVSPV